MRFGDDDLPCGHWLLEMLGGVVSLAAYFIEAVVMSSIADAIACNRRLNTMELYGKFGKRRQRHLAHGRVKILGAVRQHGSAEAIAHGISGIHGLASLMRTAKTARYADGTVSEFTDCRCLGLHWDGATHGGKDVSLGVAIRADTHGIRYLTPEALLHPLVGNCFLLAQPAGGPGVFNKAGVWESLRAA